MTLLSILWEPILGLSGRVDAINVALVLVHSLGHCSNHKCWTLMGFLSDGLPQVTAARFYYQDQFLLLSCGNRLNLYRWALGRGSVHKSQESRVHALACTLLRLQTCAQTLANLLLVLLNLDSMV